MKTYRKPNEQLFSVFRAKQESLLIWSPPRRSFSVTQGQEDLSGDKLGLQYFFLDRIQLNLLSR